MAVSIVQYPAEIVLRALDSCPPLSKDVFELQTSLGDDISACVSVLERCPSLRHLTIFNAATSISRLNASIPYNITHFTYIQAGSLPLDDLFALFQYLPVLQRLTFQFLSMVHTISPECLIYAEDRSFAVPPFKLRHYAVGHAFTASHLPILCSQSSLRILWIRSPLSPAFDQPSLIYENVSPARRVTIIREARQLFDAAVLVAPNLEQLYLNANRMTQAFDNPEPSHLPNLLPLFSAFRALRLLRLQLQLDEDGEVEEFTALLYAATCSLEQLDIGFCPLPGKVRRIGHAARALYGPACIRRLRNLGISIFARCDDPVAVQDAFRPFREYCESRRIHFQSFAFSRY